MQENFSKFNKFFESLAKSDDILIRDINLKKGTKVKLVFVDSLIDSKLFSKAILNPLLSMTKKDKEDVQTIKSKIISDGTIELITDEDTLVNKLLSGFVLVFMQDEEKVISVACQGYEKRSIAEPPTSAVLRGPREGFIEDYAVNVSLIRRRLKSKNLIVKSLQIGKITRTNIALVYLSNVADRKVVKEIEKKLKQINIDGIIDSFYIETFLENPHNKFFKQVGNSEKPDVVSAKILEGRVAIVVDGSPIVLTLPYILFEDFQSADDYFTHPYRATFIRCIRIFGVLIAIMLPGFYVAMQSFHYLVFPASFLISLLNSIESLSFPPLIEILFVLFLFEILSEASIRMPKYLGMALSIVGALILGDTAVKAGLISSPSVMMVAISSICLYTVPDQVAPASLLRVIFTVLGGVSGFYGIMLGIIFVCTYVVGLDNYGAPYLAPFAPYISEDMKDGLLKQDLKTMRKRPKSIPNINHVRLKDDSSSK